MDKKSNKKYKTIEKISEGQFGTVFKGINTENDNLVAIKKIYTSTKSSAQGKNVLREIKCMEKIKHKNVLQLYDYKIKDNSVKLIFEYMDSDLKDFIERSPYPLKNSTIKGISYMILSGLQAIHDQQIIHRDLKPSNILIDSKGVVKIGDLGSATPMSDTINGQFELEGFSRWYKAPELLYGSRNYDHRVDIWSFACIFVELLNGSPLFPGINDLDQLSRIIRVLGTPSKENWSILETLPDYGKIEFSHFDPIDLRKIVPNATIQEVEFLKDILNYNRYINVEKLLEHSYFTTGPKISTIKRLPFKNDNMSKPDYFSMLKIQIGFLG